MLAANPQLAAFVGELSGRGIYMPAGVNTQLFRTQRPLGSSGRLRVGWCGQIGQQENSKGYALTLRPLLRCLGDTFQFVINDRNYLNAVSRAEMVDWYNSIDVLLCTSSTEGSPMPPLEAMACGRPVVTTAVGDMPNSMLDGETGFLVGRTTIKSRP